MRTLLFIIFIILLLFPGNGLAGEIHLAAAMSLRELAGDAARRFESQHPHHRVLINTASSGTLARQIVAGAPADIFLSANPQWMDHLAEQGKVTPGSPADWAANRLVVVGRGAPLRSLADLGAAGRLAIGSPESVPAGRYARTMLEAAGLYSELLEGTRLIFTKDVRQALLYAEQGVVESAIVYESDRRLLQKARIILVPAADQQPDIHYPIALTVSGEENPAAQELYRLLTGSVGTELIQTYGLTPLTGAQ